jgi:hypothetical protein
VALDVCGEQVPMSVRFGPAGVRACACVHAPGADVTLAERG